MIGIILGIVIFIGVVVTGLVVTAKVLNYRDNLASKPTKNILNIYKKVPESSRPYGDIKAMLEALDLKYGIHNVNKHYQNINRTYDGLKTEFSWYPRDCYHKSDRWASACKYPEYLEIANALQNIITAHEKQQRALEIAGVQGSLDMVKQFTEQAREESKIINSVTKELER